MVGKIKISAVDSENNDKTNKFSKITQRTHIHVVEDVSDSDHQVHVVARLNGNVVGTMKVKGPTGGYTSDQQMENDREINDAVRALKAKGDEVEVWQETGEDAPQFQRGGLAAVPQSIPGSMEQGVLIYSVSGMK